MVQEIEVWLPINGYEGIYEVSNFGNVRCIYREWVCGSRRAKRKIINHTLPHHISRKGYSCVNLRDAKGVQSSKKIHRLVAWAFLPNTENKPQVNHIDGVKSNNFYKNLEWATNQENVIHSFKNKLQVASKGGEHGQARLVLNTETGIYYDCIQDAVNTINKSYLWLYKKLTGYEKNKTPFILV